VGQPKANPWEEGPEGKYNGPEFRFSFNFGEPEPLKIGPLEKGTGTHPTHQEGKLELPLNLLFNLNKVCNQKPF